MRRKTVAQAHDEQSAPLSGRAVPAAVKAKRAAAAAAVKDAATRTVEAVAQATTTLKLKTQNALDTVANEVNAQLAVLSQTNEAVAAAKAQLAELHAITVAADTLEALQAAHALELDEFDSEKQGEMDAWQQARDEEETLRTRNQEEYEYLRKRSRDADNDAWEKAKVQREADHINMLGALGAEVHERELKCRATEVELGELRLYKFEAEQVHKKDKEAAVAAAVGSARKDMLSDQAVKAAEWVGATRLLETRLSGALEKIEELSEQNHKLRAAYEGAVAKVEAIATRAIEGAAQAKVTVQQAASEQRK